MKGLVLFKATGPEGLGEQERMGTAAATFWVLEDLQRHLLCPIQPGNCLPSLHGRMEVFSAKERVSSSRQTPERAEREDETRA